MPTYTPNYNFALPLVDSSTDQDLWGGYLNSNWSSIDTLLKTIFSGAYPVGSIYIETTGVNPATTFGFGTWSAFGAGQVLVGVGSFTDGSGNSETITEGQQLGEYKHTLTTSEMPSHTHTDSGHTHPPTAGEFAQSSGSDAINIATGGNAFRAAGTTGTGAAIIQNTGGGTSHNNIQPSLGVYMWLRTA